MMFLVPDAYRINEGVMGSDSRAGNNGAFCLPAGGDGRVLFIIASDGAGWEHVSVHACDRQGNNHTPTWAEMCRVKDLFWDPEDVVMQLHPRRSQYVNEHPHTLHLWRPIGATIPEPPSILVGPLSAGMAGGQ